MKWEIKDPEEDGWYWIALDKKNPIGIFGYKKDQHSVINYIIKTNKDVYISGPIEEPLDDSVIGHNPSEE